MKTVKQVNMKPLHDWLLLEKIEPESVTPGGIVLPDVAKKEAQQGIVIAVGPGKYDAKVQEYIPMTILRGDKVYFAQWEAQEIELEGETYLLVREGSCFGILS